MDQMKQHVEPGDLVSAVNAFKGSVETQLDRDAKEIAILRERLNLITRAALNRIDGDSQPNDTHWSEIIGIAEGDPNWLRHAKINYDVDHADLVQRCRRLLGHIIDGVGVGSSEDQIAHFMADALEEELLPEMVLAENGRTFRRSQAASVLRERVAKVAEDFLALRAAAAADGVAPSLAGMTDRLMDALLDAK